MRQLNAIIDLIKKHFDSDELRTDSRATLAGVLADYCLEQGLNCELHIMTPVDADKLDPQRDPHIVLAINGRSYDVDGEGAEDRYLSRLGDAGDTFQTARISFKGVDGKHVKEIVYELERQYGLNGKAKPLLIEIKHRLDVELEKASNAEVA